MKPKPRFEPDTEVARATRPGKLAKVYGGLSIYSLDHKGRVWQAMTFRKDDEEYTQGSGWNVQQRDQEEVWTVERFRGYFEEKGFEVTECDKPKRINYDKPARVSRIISDSGDEPKRKQDKTKTGRHCRKCGEKGHNSATCGRRK